MCFVTGSKDGKHIDKAYSADNIRSYLMSVNPAASIVRLNISNLWFEDEFVDSIFAIIVGAESELSIPSASIREIISGGLLAHVPKIRLRLPILRVEGTRVASPGVSIAPTDKFPVHLKDAVLGISSELTSSHLDSWSPRSISVLLRKLSPSAVVSETVSEKEIWRVPPRTSSGFARAFLLAKVKVMSERQSQKAVEMLSDALLKIKKFKENDKSQSSVFDSLVKNLKSVHGIILLKPTGTKNPIFCHVEACSGSIILREVISIVSYLK